MTDKLNMFLKPYFLPVKFEIYNFFFMVLKQYL